MVNLEYKIVRVHTVRFSCMDVSEDYAEKLFGQQNALSFGIQIAISINKEESTLTMDVNSILKDKLTGQQLVEHTGRTSFLVRNLEQVYNPQTDTYDIPNDLLTQFYGLAYTHARALLAVEVSPTIYRDKYLLPVLDPSQFIKQ